MKWNIILMRQNGDDLHAEIFFGPINYLIAMLTSYGWKVCEIQNLD